MKVDFEEVLKFDYEVKVEYLFGLVPIYIMLWCMLIVSVFSDVCSGCTVSVQVAIELIIGGHYYLFWGVVALMAFGVKFIRRVPQRAVHLRKKGQLNIVAEFAEKSSLYSGMSDISLPNVKGVLHPVDFFIKDLYSKFAPEARDEAFDTYRRVNPLLRFRLEHLDKYSKSFELDSTSREMLCEVSTELLGEIWSDERFPDLAFEVRKKVDMCDFSDVDVDGSSAAGFPYRAGTKRRDVLEEATEVATNMVLFDECFKEYADKHVWYTTGRAKMVAKDKKDSARLISYPGLAFFLFGALYLKLWMVFMMRFAWCAVGMSWMNGGAKKFALFFGDVEGIAPDGYYYCTLDIKGWDASLCVGIMEIWREFHISNLQRMGVSPGYISKFRIVMTDMLCAVLLFPFFFLFKVWQGMKSGWGNTAGDNTLIHEMIFRCVERILGVKMKHKLYGDDNFFLLPIHIEISMIIKAYARFGIIVGVIHRSRKLSDVDFLCKVIIYKDGEYYVYKEAVESDARMLMPEEMDPSRRLIPDARIAAERLIGHLFDNPFNGEVRARIYRMLLHIWKYYGVEEIVIDHEKMKKMPYRIMDPNRVMGVIPIIPDFNFILQLYGVSKPLALVPLVGPELCVLGDESDGDPEPCFAAMEYAAYVDRCYNILSRVKKKVVAKLTSPFGKPTCKGFHAARAECVLKVLGIRSLEWVLDFGAYPGACAYTFRNMGSKIDCVTLFPEGVKDHKILPYILADKDVNVFDMDVEHFKFGKAYDLLHDDVNSYGGISFGSDLSNAKSCLKRFLRADNVSMMMMTLHDLDHEVMELMYDVYRIKGGFDMVKPVYSSPWKAEFVLLFRTCKVPRIKRTVFLKRIFGFVNKFAGELITWNERLLSNVRLVSTGEDGVECPLLRDEVLQESYRSKLF